MKKIYKIVHMNNIDDEYYLIDFARYTLKKKKIKNIVSDIYLIDEADFDDCTEIQLPHENIWRAPEIDIKNSMIYGSRVICGKKILFYEVSSPFEPKYRTLNKNNAYSVARERANRGESTIVYIINAFIDEELLGNDIKVTDDLLSDDDNFSWFDVDCASV